MAKEPPVTGTSAQTIQKRFAENPHKETRITHCAVSGLPLGYLPSRKLIERARIPFEKLSLHDVRISVEAAFLSQPQSSQRKFAFFALLYHLPSPLLLWHTEHLNPDWQDSKLRSLLSNNGLEQFAQFVECISSLHPRLLDLFPGYTIYSGFHTKNEELSGFSAILARWIGIANGSEVKRRMEMRKFNSAFKDGAAREVRLFERKKRDQRYNMFDPRRATPTQITTFAGVLATYYERENTQQWVAFVHNPSSATFNALRDTLQRVQEINIADDEFSDELQLSIEFKRWLEDHYARMEVHIEQNRKMTQRIERADVQILQGLELENVQELLDKFQELEEADGKPKREKFASLDAYMDALKQWKKGKDGAGKTWNSPR